MNIKIKLKKVPIGEHIVNALIIFLSLSVVLFLFSFIETLIRGTNTYLETLKESSLYLTMLISAFLVSLMYFIFDVSRARKYYLLITNESITFNKLTLVKEIKMEDIEAIELKKEYLDRMFKTSRLYIKENIEEKETFFYLHKKDEQNNLIYELISNIKNGQLDNNELIERIEKINEN